MSQNVILKSNKYGINLILNEEIAFDELLASVGEKFREASGFFKDAKMALSFEGRKLSAHEEQQIVDTISENSNVSIICIVENDAIREQILKGLLENPKEDACSIGQFYKGTLRSGQFLECEHSIIVLGDVNPGAKIISQGNVVVLGALKGNAYAGAGGDNQAFIAALDMDPVQLKIGDVIGRSADKALWSGSKKRKKTEPVVVEPQVAVVKDDNIYIEPITKGLLNNL